MKTYGIIKRVFFGTIAVFLILLMNFLAAGQTSIGPVGKIKKTVEVYNSKADFFSDTLYFKSLYNIDEIFNHSASIPKNQTADPDLIISQSAPSSANVGVPYTYSLTVTNVGAVAANNFNVTFVVPAGVTFNNASGGTNPTYNSNTRVVTFTGVSANTGSFPLNAAFLTVTVTPNAGNTNGSVTSSGQNVVADSSNIIVESNENNNTASDVTTQILAPNLIISQADSPDPVVAGSILTYTMTVANNGNIAASGVTAAFAVPTNTDYVGSSASQGTTSQSGGTVTANFGTINTNGTVTLTVQVRPNQSAAVTESVTSNGSGVIVDPSNTVIESNEGDNTAATITTTVQAPQLTIDQIGPSTGTVNNPITYTVTVSNLASATAGASGIQVYFPLPTGVFVAPGAMSGNKGFTGNYDALNSRFVFTGGSLNVGEQATLIIQVTPVAVGTLTSNGTGVVVDPNNTIIETNEGDNTAPTNVNTVISLTVTAPTTQASNVSFSNVQAAQMDVSWTNGNGSARIVKINTTNSFTNPTDGSSPTPNTVYNGAGEQVVFNGTGNSVTVTGLSQNTTYFYRVFEYNGSGSTTKYLTTAAAGNPNSQATSSGADTTPPDTTIDSMPPALTNSVNASFSFSGTDNVGVTSFECSLDGAQFTGCSSPQNYTNLSQGQHTFQVRAKDAAGNIDTAPASYTWTIDNNAPSVSSIIRAGANPTNADSVDFTVNFSESVSGVDASDFTLTTTGNVSGTIASVSSASGQTVTVRVNNVIGDGTLKLNLKASGTGIQDAAGNPIIGGFTNGEVYTIDNTSPNTTLTSTPPSLTNNTSATFSFVGSDGNGVGVTGFECSLDGAQFTSCSSPQNYMNLADGNHTFEVRALDAVGNVDQSPAKGAWIVDATAPDTTLTNTPPSSTSSSNASFSFTGNDGSGSGVVGFECSLDGAQFTSCSSPQNYTNLSQGQYTFQVRALDKAGNIDQTPASYTFTITSVPLVSSVTRSNPSPTAPNTNVTYTVTFNTSVSGVDATDFALTTSGVTGANIVSVSPTSGPASTYTVTVNTGTGSGAIRLDVVDDDSITDGATPLGGTGAGNGNFTTGEIYTVTPNISLSINDVVKAEGNSDTTTFTFTVSLSAPAGANGVTFNIATADNTATVADNDYVAKALTAQTIPAGSSSYTFDVLVNGDNSPEPNETFFVNVTNVTGAIVNDGQGLGTITDDEAADLVISQSAPVSVNAGTPFDYVLTVTNNGNASANNFSVTFVVPNRLTLNLSNSTGGTNRTYDSTSRTVTFTGISLGAGPGATTQLTVNVTADTGNSSGSVTSLGTNVVVDSTGVINESNEANNKAATNAATQILEPNLTISQTDSSAPVVAGSNLTYTVTITNNGGAATSSGVAATFKVPANTTYSSSNSAQGTTSQAGGIVTFTSAGSINAGGTAIFTITVVPNQTAAASGSVTSQGSDVVVDPTPLPNGNIIESNEADNTANNLTTTVQSPDLRVSQNASSTGTVNSPVTYTINVTNPVSTNAATASNITVYFPLPTGVSVNPGTAAGDKGFTGVYDTANNRYVFTGGTLNAGETGTLSVSITPTATGTLVSNGAVLVVDPNNSIIESNEDNNTAPTSTSTVISAAAPTTAKISGQIRRADGRGLDNAFITLSGGNLAAPIVVKTNPFGYYRLPEIETGKTYVLSVGAKNRTFNPLSRTISPSSDLTAEDFTSNEP